MVPIVFFYRFHFRKIELSKKKNVVRKRKLEMARRLQAQHTSQSELKYQETKGPIFKKSWICKEFFTFFYRSQIIFDTKPETFPKTTER